MALLPLVTFLFLLLGVNAAPIEDNIVESAALYYDDLNHYSQYAAAAYCQENVQKAGIKLKCASKNCPEVEASDTRTILPVSNNNFTSDVTGFVALDATRDEIIISFRGTESRRNLYVDLGYHLMPTAICKDCEASHGFAIAWNDTRQEILDAIEEAHKGSDGKKKRIVTVGHSMGAAVAGLAAADLRQRGFITDMYLYGSPRFCNKELADWITTSSPRLGKTFRVTHLNDPIPDMPISLMGHADFYPEYYISTPNGKAPSAMEILLLKALADGKGNLSQKPKDADAHSYYMGDSKISACYTGDWLGGAEPSEKLVKEMFRSWIETTAVQMMERAGEFVKNTAYDWLHLLHPTTNPTTKENKIAENTRTCFLFIFGKC